MNCLTLSISVIPLELFQSMDNLVRQIGGLSTMESR